MYFDQCKTREDLKKTYKDLCMKHHPDLGGDLETMKAINAEFDKAYRILKDVHHAGIEEDWDIPAGFSEVISKLVVIPGVEIEIVGSWVWVSGDTKPVKEQLREAGCLWSRNRGMWYWHKRDAKRRYSKSSESMDEIRGRYGSKHVASKQTPRIG